MGVGTPENILEAVERGIDLLDVYKRQVYTFCIKCYKTTENCT